MAAADKMLGHQLRRLHVVRADQIDIVKVAGAGSKHQRQFGAGAICSELCPLVRAIDNHRAALAAGLHGVVRFGGLCERMHG